MSFFDNSKNVGLALIIVGLITLIMGIATAVAGVVDADGGWLKASAVCYGIAALIFGIMILGYGLKIRKSSMDQVAVLSGLIKVIGVATILAALFNAVGAFLSTNNTGDIGGAVIAGISSMIVSIVIGIILIWIASKVAGKSKNVISKLLWIILVVVFLILAILSLINIFNQHFSDIQGILAAISAICMFIVYLYCFIATLSKDVKTSMGI